MSRSRKYKTGSRWAFWRWTDVDSEYITRLHILKTPWFAVCLHWINKPDPEPYLHDHPVTFLSLILRGWYSDARVARKWGRVGLRVRRHRWWSFIRTTTRHSIVETAPGGALTLAIMGPKTQEWGFWTPAGKISWKDYYAAQRRGVQL